MCLFLQDLIPHIDAGVFLDNDIVVMDDLALLWERFKHFSVEAAMAMAPVEAHYGVRMVRECLIILVTFLLSLSIKDSCLAMLPTLDPFALSFFL